MYNSKCLILLVLYYFSVKKTDTHQCMSFNIITLNILKNLIFNQLNISSYQYAIINIKQLYQ
jgi:hypothetical protein